MTSKIGPIVYFFCASVLITASAQRTFAQQSCENLTTLKLAHTTITSAVLVPEKSFNASRPGRPSSQSLTLPAHCEVKGETMPTSDSDIKFEVWMPSSGWNGKFQQVGNGGWAGAIPTPSMAAALMRGYATAGTDDGHTGGGNAEWAIGHPEKLVDFGYRAVHETSVQAKAIIQAFYGQDISRSYFFGCSDGGREALMEAQRYPNDFIGIIAGAPANYWTHLITGGMWAVRALAKSPESYIPPAKLPAIQKAVLAACDALDGVKDGLIEDPRVCKFDPAVLKCNGADTPDCLTEPQIEAVRKIYAGPKNPRTGEQIFPGYSPGTEAALGGWAIWITGAGPDSPDKSLQHMFGTTFYADTVFGDVKWDYHTLNFDSDVQLADKRTAPILNSNSPDLSAFRAREGKLIQYHGWGDAAIPPLNSIQYYDRVTKFFSQSQSGKRSTPVQDFYRLFMVPGMGHCAGGLGANSFGNDGAFSEQSKDPENDVVSALDRWVEKGVAPDRIVARGYTAADPGKAVTMTRPLCPYPTIAKYKGTGSTDNASNFECVVPVKR